MGGRANQNSERRGRGFQRAAGLLGERIRKAGETRGFAMARLLTHWAEIVGPETARMARPVKVSYARDGFGATLSLLAPGALAPMLQMKLPEIRDRVNACYGYAAISHIRITQTAPEGFGDGFAEAQAEFEPQTRPVPRPEDQARARDAAREVGDPGLRTALEKLAANVLAKV